MDTILQVEGVCKRFSNHEALRDMSLSVPRGCIYGLLGPNGAGKTTLIRIINRITLPDSGTVTFDGHPLTDADVAHIGYLPEERGLYKKMKVGDQAIFFARLKGMSRVEAETGLRQWFEKFGISDWWGRKVEELSKGMAQKVQFIITVLHQPKLLIFDEPFSGFDPINAEMLKREIMELRDKGATVIFSTHNMSSVEEICDEITLVNRSRNILTGNVEAIRREYAHGRYALSLKGISPETLTALLAPLTSQCDITPEGDTLNVQLRLAPDASVRDLLNRVNDVADVERFERAMASMNDIFISAVEKYNLNNPQQS